MTIVLGLLAFAIDIGRLVCARTELQRSADATALAACAELQERRDTSDGQHAMIRLAAARFAELNLVSNSGPSIDLNDSNHADGGLVLGYVAEPSRSDSPMYFEDSRQFNTVVARVERGLDQNGELPLFFTAIWGLRSQALRAEARASFLQNFRGFRIPEPAEGQISELTAPILPITIYEPDWSRALNGEGIDQLTWDQTNGDVVSGPDGFPEMHAFPADTGAGGNFALLDIGGRNMDVHSLQRQIVEGLSKSDLDYHGGELKLNRRGELRLGGMTGEKVGAVEPSLKQIIGQTRIMPVYREVRKSGTNANYTIVRFAGIRVLDVQLTAGEKWLRVQPSPMVVRGGIPAKPGESTRSEMIYSPVRLTN